jgi:hypothetical protein
MVQNRWILGYGGVERGGARGGEEGRGSIRRGQLIKNVKN